MRVGRLVVGLLAAGHSPAAPRGVASTAAIYAPRFLSSAGGRAAPAKEDYDDVDDGDDDFGDRSSEPEAVSAKARLEVRDALRNQQVLDPSTDPILSILQMCKDGLEEWSMKSADRESEIASSLKEMQLAVDKSLAPEADRGDLVALRSLCAPAGFEVAVFSSRKIRMEQIERAETEAAANDMIAKAFESSRKGGNASMDEALKRMEAAKPALDILRYTVRFTNKADKRWMEFSVVSKLNDSSRWVDSVRHSRGDGQEPAALPVPEFADRWQLAFVGYLDRY
ncbi:MAG TPA: hypothetical protein VJB16_04470, partial [archaeon]|nr:hypothetical protein [archaeon]